MRNLSVRHSFGFTLIELMFTVGILAVLMSISAPALGRLIDGSRSRGAQVSLVASLNLARGVAVSAQRHVIVCPSKDHLHCDENMWWHNGWIVFEDTNQNSRRDDDEPLREVVATQPGIAIATSIGRKFVRYRPDGSASGTDLTYTICDRRGEADAAAIVVNNTGRIREAQPEPARAAVACASLAG